MDTTANFLVRASRLSPAGLRSFRAQLLEVALLFLAVLIPALSHLFAIPVFVLLPMHWAVLVAGLTLGWFGGLLVGVLAPILSFAGTGMPVAPILPAMVLELAAYGVIPALLHQRGKVNSFIALLIGLVSGRLAFTAIMYALGRTSAPLLGFLQNAFASGLWVAAVQILLVPMITYGLLKALGGRSS